MSEQPSQTPGSSVEHRFRERITALIGVGVMLTYGIVAFAAAYAAISGDASDQSFQHLKDLLTFLSGLVGTVVGYYFGRVGVEKRAEVAESNVQIVQSAMNQAEREAAKALGQLDVEKISRDAAEKAKEVAVRAKTQAERIAQAAEQAQEQAEGQIQEIKTDMAQVAQGIQVIRDRVQSFKNTAIDASNAAAEFFGNLGGEGSPPPSVDAQEADELIAEMDALLDKAAKWQA